MSKNTESSAEQRRVALAALPRASLARLTEHFALLVADRRVADDHIDALVRTRHVDFAEILGLLSREDLKAACEALGLDASGREKQPLIDRILGRELTLIPATKGSATQASAVRASASSASAAPASAAAAIDLDPSAKLTREQLEGYLWAAADILRGSIDSSDYKGFIFGHLFLKRLATATRRWTFATAATRSAS